MPSKDKMTGLFVPWRRFKRDRRGVAAAEFALIVPLLLALYLGTMEVSNGVSLNKRVARAASTIADLVTQQDITDRAELQAIMDVGASILFPYEADNPEILIVGVDIDDDHPEGGQVVWSRQRNSDGSHEEGWTAGNDVWVPERLRIDETFVVMTRVQVKYLPIVTWVTGRNPDGTRTGLDISERYWLRPRLVDQIDCTNC
ncbi:MULTISPECIES: TadE/TadG family type IV pilus assembly protein [unclassified Roseitalea]|uniref:TadE/TadG family type IV pilus assembly protein n=1 Tax=unclassified Roseitalea TaxID=2639107 RepID=UPI00273D762F|nr:MULTISPECIES: TadE/TadG family type IV pilus assembly protein [unclassified Roseitalea]